MSFGSIFQDSFPFGAILLDSNLKVIWSNQEFCESWDMSKTKIEQDLVNWNDIYQRTNLGETDPVLDALKNSLSGIYQIRTKISESKSSTPFEMYVNPVEYLGQKRVMVFFYPLSSLEKTIADQVKSITSPIKKFLETLMGRPFTKGKMNQIRDEFLLAGVDSLFKHFQELDESLRVERQGYMGEIERVEDEVEYYQNILSDVQKRIALMAHIPKMYRNHLLDLKGDVVAFCEDTRTQYMNTEEIIINAEGVIKGHPEVMSLSSDLYEKLQRAQRALEGLEKLRKWLRKLTYSLQESHYGLQKSIEQANPLSQTKDKEGLKGQGPLEKVKIKLKGFDSVLVQLLKSIKAMDLTLSKMDMIIEKDKLKFYGKRLHTREEHFKKSRREFDALVANGKKISSKIKK